MQNKLLKRIKGEAKNSNKSNILNLMTKPRAFSPQNGQTRLFSPQPWRVFSPMNRQRRINNTSRVKRRHQIRDPYLNENTKTDLIYDAKNNEDFIYFPFTYHYQK